MRTVMRVGGGHLILLGLCILNCQLHAEDAEGVSIESLVKKAPVLTTSNPAIDSFQLEIRIPVESEISVPFVAEIAWSRDRGGGVIYWSADKLVPVMVLTGDQALLYDAARYSAQHYLDCHPTFDCSIGESNWHISYGLALNTREAVNKGPKFQIDLACFLQPVGQDAVLKRVYDDRYEVSFDSATGAKRVTAYYRVSQEWPLTRILVKDKASGDVVMDFANIRVNSRIDRRLLVFPSLARLPEQLRVREAAMPEGKEAQERFGRTQMSLFFNRLTTHAAIDDTKLRSLEIFKDVDWNKALDTNAINAPALHSAVTELDREPVEIE